VLGRGGAAAIVEAVGERHHGARIDRAACLAQHVLAVVAGNGEAEARQRGIGLAVVLLVERAAILDRLSKARAARIDEVHGGISAFRQRGTGGGTSAARSGM